MRLYLLIPACALAACTPQPANQAGPTENAAAAIDAKVPAATPAPLDPPAPGQPGGLDNDATPVSEAAFAADSAQGAANVVQTYYALIEEGKYAEAYRLLDHKSAWLNARDFAASFVKFSEYHASVGTPGQINTTVDGIEHYVTVPVQVYGRLKDDARPVYLRGSVSLFRTDAADATAEQRAWHITMPDLKASLAPAGNP